MNVCYFNGEVVSDPKRKNEKAPLEFRLKLWENNQKTYVSIVAWGKVAEIMESKHLKKGNTVNVVASVNSEKKKYPVKDENGNEVASASGETLTVSKELVEFKAHRIDIVIG